MPAPILDEHQQLDKDCTWKQGWEDMVEVFRESPEKVRALGTSKISPLFHSY
jgi:hypothetical protein